MNYSYCHQALSTVRLPGTMYNFDKNGFLTMAPIYRAMQRVVPSFLPAGLLYKSHYMTLAGHPREGRMYNTMRTENYWRHMADGIYTAVRDCCKCIWNKPYDKRRRPFQLFPASASLKLGAMNISGALKVASGKHFVLVMTDSYSR